MATEKDNWTPPPAPSLRDLKKLKTMDPETLALIEQSRQKRALLTPEEAEREVRGEDADRAFHTPSVMDVERDYVPQGLPRLAARAVGMGEVAVDKFKEAGELSDEELMRIVEEHEAGGGQETDSEYISERSRLAMVTSIKMGKGGHEELVKVRLKSVTPEPDPMETLETVKPRPQLVAEMLNSPRKGQLWPVASFHRGTITMFDPASKDPADSYQTEKSMENVIAVVAQRNGKINIYEAVGPAPNNV